MEEKKKKLLEEKNKLEARVKADQGKIKLIEQELKNIELEEELQKRTDIEKQLINELKDKGIDNLDILAEFIKEGKVKIG